MVPSLLEICSAPAPPQGWIYDILEAPALAKMVKQHSESHILLSVSKDTFCLLSATMK